MALGYGMLVAAIRATWSPTVVGLVVGAGGLTALVVARQVIGVRENLVLVAERQARRSEARFRSLVQNASDLIVVLDKTFAIQYETPSVERILGYRFEDLHKTRLVEMVHPDDVPVLRTLIVETAASGGSQGPVEIRIARSDGSWIFLEASATNLLDDPDIAGLVLTIRNVDDRKRLEVRLTHQASHDSLTGLANRALINERVSDALAAAPIRGESVVVLFIDLDNLKTVNDSLGHDSGDRALIEVSRRIRASTRTADLVGRVAGDEFAVLLESPGTEAAGVALSERILSAMDAPYELDGLEIQLGVSIGVAVSAEGEDSSTEVLRNADCAMYAAKTGGKGRYVVFKPGMQAPARERLDVEAALRHALEQHQLDVYFQPIVELASGQISGAEALLRWHRPDTGLVLPGEFIHIAEETGLIVPIGAWVLEQACLAAASWPTVAGTTKPPSLAVNLSARQLQDPHLVELVADVVARTRIDPARLVLEVTESLVIQDPEQTIPRLHALKALGVRLAIDDFGTGYSSLSYLRTLPVDEVKVDRSFVADLDRAMGSALVHGIVELGHSLGLDIVAEGIEYVDQAAALVQFGCEYGQGFHFARPMPLPEFTRLLISGIDNHRRRTKPRQLAAASRADAHERTA